MNSSSKIYIAGHNGMVGSAILKKLKSNGYSNIIYRTSTQLNLKDQNTTLQFFNKEKPEYVFLAAAKVGGILANNTLRGEFIYDNLMIQTNVIHNSYLVGVKKLLFLGSSCIYPKLAPQPLKEDSLLGSPLESTNEPYAIAKIAGVKMCQAYNNQYGCNFISLMPTNLYGPNDNYDLETSHVLAALIRKFHEAKIEKNKKVEIWGTGNPLREFMHTDDLAAACVFLMNNYNHPDIINVGTGIDISIKDLACLIKEITGYHGDVAFDTTKPDGTPRKLLDVGKLNRLGFTHSISLEDGVKMVYKDFIDNLLKYTGTSNKQS